MEAQMIFYLKTTLYNTNLKILLNIWSTLIKIFKFVTYLALDKIFSVSLY